MSQPIRPPDMRKQTGLGLPGDENQIADPVARRSVTELKAALADLAQRVQQDPAQPAEARAVVVLTRLVAGRKGEIKGLGKRVTIGPGGIAGQSQEFTVCTAPVGSGEGGGGSSVTTNNISIYLGGYGVTGS